MTVPGTTVRVKICGLTAPEGFDAAVEAGADWIGFNFVPASPRYVSPAQAAALSARHPGGPARVGLFMDPAEADLAAVLDALPLDAVQVYAPPARVAALRARFGVPAWQPVGVAARTDLPIEAPGLDALLVESKPPQGAILPGGNARSFDWAALRGWAAPLPWLLAGGLHPGNVAEAVRLSGAGAVDVSSGVERARGVKDAALIRAFVAAARS